MKKIENHSTMASTVTQCPRQADTDHVWQVRPLTIREYSKRMLKTSCEYFCAERRCEVISSIN